MERPNKCYIRQEWYEAVSFMSKEDRCDFYESLMTFVYYGSQRDTLPPMIKGVFEMAKPYLLKDISSYSQIAVRNRQNGSNGGRPQGGITQKNPEKPKETQKPIYIQTHIQTQKNISTLGDFGEKEKIILIEFFLRGNAFPLKETRNLCDYYDARGWVDKGGNPIVDAAAIARVWKCQELCNTYFANIRQKWGQFCKTLPADMPAIIVTDFVRLEIKSQDEQPKTAHIYCKSREFIETIENAYITQLKLAVTAWGAKKVEYHIQPEKVA